MRWYNNLYVGKNAKKIKKKIIKCVNENKALGKAYLITLPLNDKNVLDIYPDYILIQNYYKRQDMYIVGIADGYEEAKMMVSDILLDCYKKTGQFKVRLMIE
ncbi:hypothetical protein SAMN02910289_01164 [Lachnospiraceae bacterium RM5]|nr:hypothetical protein SAMN02910289_01164 [Lachnospiraceae bacterium RM5]